MRGAICWHKTKISDFRRFASSLIWWARKFVVLLSSELVLLCRQPKGHADSGWQLVEVSIALRFADSLKAIRIAYIPFGVTAPLPTRFCAPLRKKATPKAVYTDSLTRGCLPKSSELITCHIFRRKPLTRGCLHERRSSNGLSESEERVCVYRLLNSRIWLRPMRTRFFSKVKEVFRLLLAMKGALPPVRMTVSCWSWALRERM